MRAHTIRTRRQPKDSTTIILGVDPGTLVTGYGVIEVGTHTATMLSYDVIKNSSTESLPVRLKKIYSALCAVIEKYHPDEFAIETAFYGKNVQSALKIGHARGVSILAAVNYEIPTAEYSPREVKKAVTGNGAASKQQVQYMVQSQLQLQTLPNYFDATDALAVALCHSLRKSSIPMIAGKKKNTWEYYIHQHPERVVKIR